MYRDKKVNYHKQIVCRHACHKNFGHGRDMVDNCKNSPLIWFDHHTKFRCCASHRVLIHTDLPWHHVLTTALTASVMDALMTCLSCPPTCHCRDACSSDDDDDGGDADHGDGDDDEASLHRSSASCLSVTYAQNLSSSVSHKHTNTTATYVNITSL